MDWRLGRRDLNETSDDPELFAQTNESSTVALRLAFGYPVDPLATGRVARINFSCSWRLAHAQRPDPA